jgi:hypothetical protein
MKWKNTFLVGIYKCELTYLTGKDLHAKWSPHLPSRHLSETGATRKRGQKTPPEAL